MKISYHWLQNYIDLAGESPEKIAERLTFAGLEVESLDIFEEVRGSLEGVVIGEVLSCEPHPNADKLKITTVDVGNNQILPIVCGASNVAKGQKVAVALANTTLYPTTGEPITLKKTKIRGEVSEGMICAEDELGLGNSHEGIIVLDTKLPNGTPANQFFQKKKDTIFEIGLTPNRVDAASHYGVARDLKALLQKKLQFPDLSAWQENTENSPIQVIVENTDACPRYTGVCIMGIKVAPSPAWLQFYLKAIGLNPINNVVDITNFVLHELGQPLHAFDLDTIQGKQIRVKTLPQGTPFTTLDQTERKLQPNDLMICDGNSQPMCFGGVFGGLYSGVSEKTQNIFLESAYFHPTYVRKTSQAHGLKTDASFRFERGADPNMTIDALKRAALLIKEIAGGTIQGKIIDAYPHPIPHAQFSVSYKNINRLIGVHLGRYQIQEILESLDIDVNGENNEGFQVTVPPYRVDVRQEADIVEEILRIYGFNRLEIPQKYGAEYLAEFPEKDANQIQYKTTAWLAAQGYFEIINNSLTSPKYAQLLGKEDTNVVILNRLSEDLEVMRQSLLFSGLETIAYNLNRRQKDLKLFEFGKVYQLLNQQENTVDKKYSEQQKLAIFITGNEHAESWVQKSKPSAFHHLANTLQQVFAKMRYQNYENQPITDDAANRIWAYGLQYGNKKHFFAKAGLLQNNLLKALDIKQPVWYAEIEWEMLLQQYHQTMEFQEISKYPEVRRDLSLVLDKNIGFDRIEQVVKQREKQLIKNINVFDVYEGANLGEGKKAYALSFILQDLTQTLTDKVIDKTMEKLMQAFEKELGAVIRK
ncbi:MAG: phenylalanine--tRNA ligase subunit beta [Cytophagales bacterium]|nr:MAG: phenylalanine--tRNA ligase subunit beta [Cytophagales bacterium]